MRDFSIWERLRAGAGATIQYSQFPSPKATKRPTPTQEKLDGLYKQKICRTAGKPLSLIFRATVESFHDQYSGEQTSGRSILRRYPPNSDQLAQQAQPEEKNSKAVRLNSGENEEQAARDEGEGFVDFGLAQ